MCVWEIVPQNVISNRFSITVVRLIKQNFDFHASDRTIGELCVLVAENTMFCSLCPAAVSCPEGRHPWYGKDGAHDEIVHSWRIWDGTNQGIKTKNAMDFLHILTKPAGFQDSKHLLLQTAIFITCTHGALCLGCCWGYRDSVCACFNCCIPNSGSNPLRTTDRNSHSHLHFPDGRCVPRKIPHHVPGGTMGKTWWRCAPGTPPATSPPWRTSSKSSCAGFFPLCCLIVFYQMVSDNKSDRCVFIIWITNHF